MSFGFSIGDIIAVSTLARGIWTTFRDASDQFNAIQTDVAGLCLVLDDIKNNLSGLHATDEQAADISLLMKGCRGVLNDTERYIRKNECLGTESSGLGSKAHKAWKKLKWDSTTVNELRDRMVSSTTYLNAFNTNFASQVSRTTNEKVKDIAEDIQSLRLKQSGEEREAVLQWLSPLNFTPQQNELSGRRQQATGSWLLESQEFQEWKGMVGKTLVCQGMPGAGKTVLASLVIDHLQQISSEDRVGVAYIYCDYKRQDEQTPLNLTASVTKQLLQYQVSIPESIAQKYQRHQSKGTRPEFEEVLEMTGASMAAFSRLCLIVDALDELGNAGQIRQTLIGRLRSLQDVHHFNLMTTSRHIPSLALEFNQPLSIEVKASPEDVRKYVEGHISDLPICVRKNMGLQETIANAIVDAVEGMFLLAQLHMDSLRDKGSPKLIKKALEILPRGSDALDLAYHGAMQRIEGQMEGFRVRAKEVLGWLTHSERLMTVEELQHALAIEPDTSAFDEDNLSDVAEIVSFCAGLVIIDDETQVIRLVHYTTQEYFRRNSDKSLVSARHDIAISCLTYLLYDEFGDGWTLGSGKEENTEEDEAEQNDVYRKRWGWQSLEAVEARVQKFPFLKYASMFWATHVRVCEQRNVKELMMRFVKANRKVSSAGQVMLDLDRQYEVLNSIDRTCSRSPLAAVHVIAYLGIEEMMSELLHHGFEVDAEDSTGRTPLLWAASHGRHAVVNFLLSQSHVDVNRRGLRSDGAYDNTALGEAAALGDYKIVKLLIEPEDVDVNLPDGSGSSPLLNSIRSGPSSSVFELLLTRSDIDVNSRNNFNCTPLMLAVMCGYADMVRQLLKWKDIRVDWVGSRGSTPLGLAASFGDLDVVKILLSHFDIDVNLKDKCGGGTALHEAALNGQTSTVKLLLSRLDIDVNQKDEWGYTPLHRATYRGNEALVRMLLEHIGIEVNLKDKSGQTALYQAVKNGHTSTVKLFLSRLDIEVNPKDYKGRTPLAQAIESAHAAVVKLLCAHPDVELDPRVREDEDVLAGMERSCYFTTKREKERIAFVQKRERCREILRTAIETRSRERLPIPEVTDP